MLLRSRHKFQQGKKRLGRDLNPMSLQDNKMINNFKLQHEKESCDQESVANKRNEVVTSN